MSAHLYDYSGYLTFAIAPDAVSKIQAAARDSLGAIEIDVSPSSLELEYSGSDAGRKVVRFLHKIAPVIGNANGSVECRFSDDTGDGNFEFYTIHQCRLYRQRAEIVKQKMEEVDLDDTLALPGRHVKQRGAA